MATKNIFMRLFIDGEHSRAQQKELRWRMARRGWQLCTEKDFALHGLYIHFGNPDSLGPDAQCLVVVLRDRDSVWTDKQIERVDYVIVPCRALGEFYGDRYSAMKPKLAVCCDGVRSDLIRDIERKDPPQRGAMTVICSSAEDLAICDRVRGLLPDVKTTLVRSFENDDCLYRTFLSGSVFLCPTRSPDWSFGLGIKAMACGAIPVTTPMGAAPEYMIGIAVDGDPNEVPTQASFARAIYALLCDAKRREELREEMMRKTRVNYNVERMIDGLENLFLDLPPNPGTHFTFQVKHATGKIINIGCDQDPCGFGQRGATNVDITAENPILGYKTAAHIIADVREGLPVEREYDSAILGDIIEHIRLPEIGVAIKNAAATVKPGGKVIVTFPDDTRTIEEQCKWHTGKGTEHYGENSHALHDHRMDIDYVKSAIEAQGLTIEKIQDVDYGFHMGYALLCRVPA
jgi:hypothetical protein